MTGRRQFYFGEYRRMIYADNMVYAYNARKNAGNWVSWMNENPELADMLAEAEKLCR